MVYKRYIRRRVNGKLKLFGPYYYESKKVDGKVISTYIGPSEKENLIILKLRTRPKIFFLSVSIIALIIILFFVIKLFPTGKISSEIPNTYFEGEVLSGNINLILKNGELIPANTKLIIDNAGEISEYSLRELLPIEVTIDNFYVEDKEIIGSGEGYGIAGENPDISPSKGFGKEYLTGNQFNLPIDLSNLNIVARQGILRVSFVYNDIEITSATQEIEIKKQISKTGITGTVPGEKVNESNITIPINEPVIETGHGEVIVNQPVKWTKKITLENKGNVRVEIPGQAENIVVYKISEDEKKEKVSDQKIKITAKASAEIILDKNGESLIKRFFKKIINFITGKVVTVQETRGVKEVFVDENEKQYEIEYEIPGPYKTEQLTEKGKIIEVLSQDINYESVLVSTELDESLNVKNPSSIRIHWQEQDVLIKPEKVEDKDSNGIYDYLEFIAPYSNQIFEVIVITKAEHLDSNRNFISDIYEEVKELDDIFSEEIKNNEYVRVTFEQNLMNENDITLFPKIASGDPRIEVYEEDSDLLITEFSNLIDNEYNKVLLTNLQGEQDTFDLKIVGGSLFFDHVVDPLVNLFYDTFTDTTGTLLTSHAPDIGTSWTQVWTSGGNLDIEFNQLQHTGTINDGGIGIANPTPTSSNYTVSVLYAVADNQDDTSTLVLRWINENNFYSFRWSTTASQSLINKRVSGTCTVINSTCPSPSQGQTVRFEVIGSQLSVYYNNILACSVIDTSLTLAGAGGTGVGATPCDTNNDVSSQRLDNFNMTEIVADTTPPIISNPNINDTEINQNEYFCLNATATDVSGINSVLAEVWNTTNFVNYTMSDTGNSCSGVGGDDVYGVSIQGIALGLWNYNKVYANDTLGNLNAFDFSDLTINVIGLNQPPTVNYVQSIPSQIPLEGTTRTVVFETKVSDPNGVGDINNSKVRVNFSMPGEQTRYGNCLWSSDINSMTANYSCSVNMLYYDASGTWNVSINATDLSGALAVNNTQTFVYLELKAMVITSPIGALNWPILNPGATNLLSTNHPNVIENTGNYEGPLLITASDLVGETNPSETIPAINFRAGPSSGSECTATQLQNGVSVSIAGSNLPRGPGATEEIYYCLNSVPFVSSQTYSAVGANSWTIGI